MQKFVSCFCDPNLPEFPIEVEMDLEDQRMISVDVARTKSDMLTADEKSELEKILTFYCKTKKHSYKQGMNEILVPFLLLSRQGIPKHIIYTCYSNFIEKFLPTLFQDDFFKPLSGLFTITKLILLYHYPDIHTFFEQNAITADIYMTSWFVTIFANKIRDIGLLYMFWKTLSAKGEVFFLCYMGVAMIGYYRSLIMSHDTLTLPLVFKEILIKDYDDYHIILSTAESLKEKMPYTTEWVLKKYEIFKLEKSDFFSNALEKLKAISIQPRGILTQIYPHDQVCQCLSPHKCSLQSGRHLLIDCRPFSETKNGFFMNSQLIPKSIQKSEKKLQAFANSFMTVKFSHHISLMGSGGTQEEEPILTKTLQSFIQAGFPHISIVDGGYLECHDFASLHSLVVLQHKERSCLVCLENIKKQANGSKIENFFKFENLKKFNSLMLDKVFRCKVNDEQEENTGLSIVDKKILVIDLRTNCVAEELQIENILKITCDKKKAEILSFFFKDSRKRVWVLDSAEVQEFLRCVKEIMKHVKQIRESIRQLV